MDYEEEARNPNLWALTRSPTLHTAYFTDSAATQALWVNKCVLCLILKAKFQGN